MLQSSRPQYQLLKFLSSNVSQSPKITSKLRDQRFSNCVPQTAGDFMGGSHKLSKHISVITLPSGVISIIFIFIFSFTPHPVHNRPWLYFQCKLQIIKYLCSINKTLSVQFIQFVHQQMHIY